MITARTLRRLRVRLLATLSRRTGTDLDEEVASHVAMHVDDNLRAGMSPDEARRVALARLGSVTAIREAHREARVLSVVHTVLRDIRHAVRLLHRQPLLSSVAVLSLGLGIGACTSIFAILDPLLLRPLPVRHADRLTALGTGEHIESFTYPVWQALRRHAESVDGMAAFTSGSMRVTIQGASTQEQVLLASGDYFDVLGVAVAHGRPLTRLDDGEGGEGATTGAVISHRLWRSRFSERPSALGESLVIDDVPFTIVGVLPERFLGVTVGSVDDIVIPLAAEPLLSGEHSRLSQTNAWWLSVVLRLRPGQSVDAAQAALQAVQDDIRAASLPGGTSADQHLQQPLALHAIPTGMSHLRETYAQALWILMITVGLVMLVACANVVNLLLARAHARAHEMSLRVSLGASTRRLLGQLLIESLVLATAGCLLGLGLARVLPPLLVDQIAAGRRHLSLDVGLEWRTLGFAVAVTFISAIVIGIVPALRATWATPGEALREQSRAVAGQRMSWAMSGAVVVQVALSLVLVASAGAFVHTFTALTWQSFGVDRDRLLVARVSQGKDAPGREDTPTWLEGYRRAASALPGSESASASAVSPLSGMMTLAAVDEIAGKLLAQPLRVQMNSVSPGFFNTYGTAIHGGRDFTTTDTSGSEPVAIVNQAFADRYLPDASVLGTTLRTSGQGGQPPPPRTIVGVVANATYAGPRQPVSPILYLPLAQGLVFQGQGQITVRARAVPVDRLVEPLRVALESVAPGTTANVQTLDGQLRVLTTRERVMAGLASALGSVSLVLAAVGLYGVCGYVVGLRRRELGIRTALGAVPSELVQLVLGRITLAVVAGVGLGLGVTAWAARFVRPLLYGTEPHDPRLLAGASVVLLLAAVVAALIPALRTARTNAADVLRQQ